MSFKSLPKKELLRTAEEDFAVDVSKSDNKAELVAKLTEAGVTWQMYEAANPQDEPEPEPEVDDNNVIRKPQAVVDELTPVQYNKKGAPEQDKDFAADLVLVKMERANPYYEIRGYKFSKANPFQLVKEDDVDYLTIDMVGFRIATPREVKEYYS